MRPRALARRLLPSASYRSSRGSRSPRLRRGITSLALAFALLARADGVSRADPILGAGDTVGVEADNLDVDVTAGTAVLTGRVTLTKGDLKVSCPRLEVRFDTTPHVKWAKGSGGVSADVRGVHAEAPEVELDLGKLVLELHGGVRLTRGHGFLQADRATIDIGTAHVTLAQVRGSIPVPPKP